MRYIRYSRKSSESKEKQALSIKDQNFECERYISQHQLKVEYKFEESKSAYKPNNRPYFDQMIKIIESGEADCIIVWKEDRLCRNPRDGGNILQLLQDKKLKEIHCVSSNSIYTPDSDHLILQIHFGMANQYSRNLSQNVKRGLERKIVDRKEYPRPAPYGFDGIGDRGRRNITPNIFESEYVKKAFQLASEGHYSLGKILSILHKEGMQTKKGKRVSKSHLHNILTCPTYYGYFFHNGELYEGSYEPIISKKLFDTVQEKLKIRTKPKLNSWNKDLNGLIKCGDCGCSITTTVKRKTYKRTGRTAEYTYHHCTHRRGNCEQKPITNSQMVDMFKKELEQIQISKEEWNLGIKLVKSRFAEEIDKNKQIQAKIGRQQQIIRDKINSLIELRVNGEISSDEFKVMKNKLTEDISRVESRSGDNAHSVNNWLELAEDFFDNAFQVKDIFENGTIEEKKKILTIVGKNFFLRDKKLKFEFNKPYDALLKVEYRTNVLPD